jgi:hypothetical protein
MNSQQILEAEQFGDALKRLVREAKIKESNRNTNFIPQA